MEAGDVVEARRLSVQMDAAAERVGQPVMRWMTLYSAAQWSFLAGDTAAGEQLAEEALALGTEIGQPDALPYFATQLSHARWQQGRLAEVVGPDRGRCTRQPGHPRLRRRVGPGPVPGGSSNRSAGATSTRRRPTASPTCPTTSCGPME